MHILSFAPRLVLKEYFFLLLLVLQLLLSLLISLLCYVRTGASKYQLTWLLTRKQISSLHLFPAEIIAGTTEDSSLVILSCLLPVTNITAAYNKTTCEKCIIMTVDLLPVFQMRILCIL